jgi:hypothetical protein
MRVLVTGSQLWADKKLIFEELDWLLEEVCSNVETEYIFTLVHGDCPKGADAYADEWGRLRKGQGFPIVIERHPADWNGPHKKGAGYARNAEMVKLGADLCLAFIRNESNGVTHCAGLAEKAGIEVVRFHTISRSTTMATRRVENELMLENVRLVFRNFAGVETPFNAEGKRNFSVVLDRETAERLEAEGWGVKMKPPREEGDDPFYHLPVTVQFDKGTPPKLWLITKSKNRRNPLNAELAGMLDYAEFSTVDIKLSPFNWEVQGKKGCRAYLKKGFFTILEDELDMKYSNIPDEGGPLEIENVVDAEVEMDSGWEIEGQKELLP